MPSQRAWKLGSCGEFMQIIIMQSCRVVVHITNTHNYLMNENLIYFVLIIIFVKFRFLYVLRILQYLYNTF
jgi:hypothetical protein